MSKTPRTDKQEFIVYPHTGAETYAVLATFARDLERELRKANKRLKATERDNMHLANMLRRAESVNDIYVWLKDIAFGQWSESSQRMVRRDHRDVLMEIAEKIHSRYSSSKKNGRRT